MPVVRVVAGFGAKCCDGVVGGAVPVGEEIVCSGVKENELGDVGRPAGCEVQ